MTDAPAASAAGLPPGEYVCVSVEDNGVGMSAEVRGRIFEPFFTTKGDRGGTGLGLPSVLGIVQQSGGRLTVVSAAGDGTKVTILLPRAGAESVSPLPARSSSAARPTRAATIMVVEDEEQLRELIRRMLERAGYTVLTTGDAEAAEPMAEQYDGAIDLLLTDVVLPRLNGRLVAEAVSRHRPGIQVLFMSGYTEDAIVHHGVLDEGIAFLGKPFTRDDLLDQIATMLSSAEG